MLETMRSLVREHFFGIERAMTKPGKKVAVRARIDEIAGDADVSEKAVWLLAADLQASLRYPNEPSN